MLFVGILIKKKVTGRIIFFNERLKQRITMFNSVKNRLISYKYRIMYHNRYRNDHVEDNLCLDEMIFFDKICFINSFMN